MDNSDQHSKELVFELDGLDCADCAIKLQQAVASLWAMNEEC